MVGVRRSLQVLAIVGWLVACTDAGPQISGITVGATSGSDPTVTATDPDSATQDTTLDVVISGSNFDPGSGAQWAIAGVPSAKVRTNATRFVSSKRLIANITIAVDADTGAYDVIVITSTGKKGIGTELFVIRAKQLVQFSPALSLFSSGVPDYGAPSQPVNGTNTRNGINVVTSPFDLTLDFVDEIASGELATKCQGGTFDFLRLLQEQPQPLHGLLGITVDKKQFRGTGESSTGVVVNFTVIVGGEEFFVTTGRGVSRLVEEASQTIVAKTGGFVRINKVVNNQIVATNLCNDIVDYEFTASK